MYQIIEQLASDTGVTIDDATYIFTVISEQMISKIPELKQVIDDIFTNADADKLKEHVSKMIVLLQQQYINKFKAWSTPQATHQIRETGNDQIF